MQVNGCPNNAARSRAAAINAPCCEQRQSVRSSVAEIADSASRSAAPKLAMHQRKEMRRAARSRVPDASHDSHVTTKTRRATPRNPRRPVCQSRQRPPQRRAKRLRARAHHRRIVCVAADRQGAATAPAVDASSSSRRQTACHHPSAQRSARSRRVVKRGDNHHGLDAPREAEAPSATTS